MLAGDSNQRNFTYPVPDVEKSHWTGELKEQKFLKQWALGFNCLNYKAAPEPALYRHFLPEKSYLDKHCTEGIRLELMFPSCWDGKNLAGINNDKRSHVAYPSLGNTGTCPEGFPVRLISLFFESIWNTYEFKDQEGQFVFSNGDPTGTLNLPITNAPCSQLTSQQVTVIMETSSLDGTRPSFSLRLTSANLNPAKLKTAQSLLFKMKAK